MSALLDGLRGLGAGRLVALGAVALAMMSLLTVLAFRGSNEQMALLYGDLDLRESSQIADLLTRQKLGYQLSGGGSQILVAAAQVPQARLLLAKEGLPTGGSIGYEIFDRGDNLTASQFQQSLNQSRALEGELARTIRGIKGVKSARVHLVLPKREPFARDRQDAQASVQLTMVGIARLDNEGTRAILNLVAAAVPGLRPQNIAVTDTRGNLLARAGEPIGPSMAAQGNDELRRAGEVRIAHAIEEMLERSLGPGRVRAEAAIEFDYEQVHETQERYDPDQQVVRSSQTVSNNTKTTEQPGTVSVQNNLPNADASASPSGTQEQRQEETTNYEITKTVRTIVRDQPKLARLSLAVMVDGVTVKGLDGVAVWKERPPEELERIGRLVRSAVGFDEKRGDKIEIVSLKFQSDSDTENPVRELLPFGLDKADLMRLLQTGMFGLLAIIALMLVLRPMVARLTLVASVPALAHGAGLSADVLLDGEHSGGEHTTNSKRNGAASIPALTGPAQARSQASLDTGILEDESMVNLDNVEGQLRASSIRRIADLVEKHPDESLSIVRAWMQQEAT
jgi:flagellar M-ring protein FliF